MGNDRGVRLGYSDMHDKLSLIGSSLTTAVERRLFTEYGAIFVTTALPPPVVIFTDAAEVEEFQGQLTTGRGRFGEYSVELQAEAMSALEAAASELRSRGRSLSARAADSGGRTYQDTVALWSRNVSRGADHWQALGRMSAERAESLRDLSPTDQIALVLELEETEQLYFGTFFDRSILYSVAAPGASQHLALLAFDVVEYEDRVVEEVLNDFGWYRTVMADLPHFTFLGHEQEVLASLGLKQVTRRYQDNDYRFWAPDPDCLNRRY